jgi:Kef-type K+ transport system membrane component KefB
MSSQGKGYGPISDAIGTVFWIVAALAFSGVCGVVMALGAFVAGLVLGN